MDKFYVGKIVKAQGIRGEVKVKGDASVVPLLKKLKTLYIGDKAASVVSFRPDGDCAFILFSGIADRNHAETLVELDVYADYADVTLGADDYFVKDVVGCEVRLNSGEVIGKVTDILQNGRSADVFVVESGDGREIMFPFVSGIVTELNVRGKTITLDEKRFGETAVHED